MFYEISGEIVREVLKEEHGSWFVSYETPCAPRYISEDKIRMYHRIEPPKEFLANTEKKLTNGQKKRFDLIAPLLNDEIYIKDKQTRLIKIKEIAENTGTTIKRVQNLFYKWLAGRSLVEKRIKKTISNTEDRKNFSWAINTFYFSAKKLSLRTTYDFLLLSKYTDSNGDLMSEYPSWNCFRHYFYRENYHKKSVKMIAREGLSNYQRNKRPLFGSASGWKDKIGIFQMDATQADIFLVSRIDKSTVIGRPYIYMAVDTVTQLIAGIYIGLDAGEQAVINCLANAAMDKVEFCKRNGVNITKDKWPNIGLPGEVITDKGREFIGKRIDELCIKYGIEFESLPPFRPDEKGLVEKMFDLIQQKYKPLLRGKGVIEPDAQERWSVDYRSQAILDIDEFTKIIIHCVIYLNSSRILDKVYTDSNKTIPTAAAIWEWYDHENLSLIIPIDEDELYRFGLPRKNAILSRKGINHQGLWYISPDYKEILENRRIGEKIQICYDPDNMDDIYMIEESKYIKFSLADYCRMYVGVSNKEYQLKKTAQKKKIHELKESDTKERVYLIQNLKSVINNAESVNKKKSDKKIIQEGKEIPLN